jgi:hypothetical protein
MKTLQLAPIVALGLSSIAVPAWGFDLLFNPPPELTLGGISINEGVFTLTEVTALAAFDDTLLSTENLAGPDGIAVPVTIGDTETITLLSIPDFISGVTGPPEAPIDFIEPVQALRLVGFADPVDPDLPPANFHIGLTGINNPAELGTGDFTYFLPSTVGPGQPPLFQITDLGATPFLGDNVNTFSTGEPTIVVSGGVISRIAGGVPLGSSQGNNCPPPAATPHAGGGGAPPAPCVTVPEPTAGLSLLVLGTLGVSLSSLNRKKSK